MERKAYPSDVSLVAIVHDLREEPQLAQGRAAQPSAVICDHRTLQSTYAVVKPPESRNDHLALMLFPSKM